MIKLFMSYHIRIIILPSGVIRQNITSTGICFNLLKFNNYSAQFYESKMNIEQYIPSIKIYYNRTILYY